MSYLLVGAGGFVSANFQKYLKNKNKKFKLISSKKYNLLDQQKCKSLSKIPGSDYNIIFFSAITPDKGKDYLTFKNNILMISNFLEFFPKNKISHFNYISSDAVYSLKEKNIDENTICSPDDLYGSMHFSREKIVESYFSDNQNFSIIRPTLIYGVGDTHNSYGPNRFIKQMKENNKIVIFGKGLDTRDHIHISDVIDLIYKISNGNQNGIYNLATGNSYTFISLAKKIKKINKNLEIDLIPNNNTPTSRKFKIHKIKKIKSSYLSIDKGIEKYF